MILGVDVGARRIGISIADEETFFARPLETIDVAVLDPIERIAELVTDLRVSRVVIGKPVTLSGHEGPAVDVQRGFLEGLRDRLGVEVIEFDERLTTVIADQGMRAAGTKRGARKELRDAIAAQIMLQGYLDSRP